MREESSVTHPSALSVRKPPWNTCRSKPTHPIFQGIFCQICQGLASSRMMPLNLVFICLTISLSLCSSPPNSLGVPMMTLAFRTASDGGTLPTITMVAKPWPLGKNPMLSMSEKSCTANSRQDVMTTILSPSRPHCDSSDMAVSKGSTMAKVFPVPVWLCKHKLLPR